ncbi:hypothetical protein O181_006631 [Austropuccinia psidii MF-1]|uniref:Uncharacterized protein n=1 Tax=Austropuccinia psidii MF-1 TaxID=1389203 RepID=A0A9Q3GGX7_9BASI|nr:hypothetical protein [Austropuccinia psidii MF-1]
MDNNSDELSTSELKDTPDNPAYVPLEDAPQNSIEPINITDIWTEFFEEVRESYKKDNNCHILAFLFDKDCKDTYLVNSLDEIWKTSYSEGIFHFFNEIIYQIAKHSCVITLCSRFLINNIIH